MTIDEAIKNLTEDIANSSPTLKPEYKEARRLGREALKRFRIYQGYIDLHSRRLLPGETED